MNRLLTAILLFSYDVIFPNINGSRGEFSHLIAPPNPVWNEKNHEFFVACFLEFFSKAGDAHYNDLLENQKKQGWCCFRSESESTMNFRGIFFSLSKTR